VTTSARTTRSTQPWYEFLSRLKPQSKKTEEETLDLHSIDPIPEDTRYGKPRSMFTLWFAITASALTVVNGAVAISTGLSIWASIVAIFLGTVVGATIMAYHAVQGPRLGLPQMVQSRAQFGFYGVLVPNIVVIFGYFASVVFITLLLGSAVAGLWHISIAEGLAVMAFITWAVSIVGYRAIHSLNKVATAIAIALFVAFTIRLLQNLHHVHYKSHTTTTAFLTIFTINLAGQLSFAPYVSDYSRYLPKMTSTVRVVGFTLVGAALGTTLFSSIGVIAGASALSDVNENTVGYLSGLFPAVTTLLVYLLVIVTLAGNVPNVYGFFLTTMTSVSAGGSRRYSLLLRALLTAPFVAAAGYVAAVASGNLLTDLLDFLTDILIIIVPWSAINLADFFFLRKGEYDVNDIVRYGGRYGLFSVVGVGAFLIGVLAQLPFVDLSKPKVVGLWAHSFGGFNAAWVVGFAVSAAVYLLGKWWRPDIQDLRNARADRSEVDRTASAVSPQTVAPSAD
jgi:nucleobase:cation symporter-1, NCS1 family